MLEINGVFKGGGAKGVVYAGALKAADARGLQFRSVAGSSAGAITATLVAARVPPADFATLAGEGLALVDRRLAFGLMPFAPKAIFSVRRLSGWLERLLRQQARGSETVDPQRPVTFQELYFATGIELNVVAMDLHRRQPIVFNWKTAGDCQVVPAVLASCAIPLAMPAGRVTVADVTDTRAVHRLVDGGTWANYPAFVYTDPSFRSYHGMSPVAERPTVGFVIEPQLKSVGEREHVVEMSDGLRSDRDLGAGARAGRLGALLSWRFFRFFLTGVVPLASSFILIDWLQTQSVEFFPSIARLSDPFEPLLVAGLVGLVALLMLLTVSLGALLGRFGREAFDIGLPSLLASMSVGPRVPDWVGSASGDRVVRLSVPDGISTLKFRGVSDAVRDAAVTRAYDEARHQLDQLFGVSDADGEADIEAVDDEDGPAPSPTADVTEDPGRFFFGAALLILIPGIAYGATELLGALSLHRWLHATGWAAFTAAFLTGVLYAGAKQRAYDLNRSPSYRRTSSIILLAVALLLCGATWREVNYGGSITRFSRTEAIPGKVLDECCSDSTNRLYEVELSRPLPTANFVGAGTATRFCGNPQRTSCLFFDSNRNGLEIGERVDVLVVDDTHEAFLDGEQWTAPGLAGQILGVALLAVFLVYLFWAFRRVAVAFGVLQGP